MVDNFDIIEPLLNWRSDDDFYFIQVLQRKKDHKDKMRVNGTNNNARLVKAYYVTSMESFQFYKPEIIELCKVFNARAGINLNRRCFKRVQLRFLKKIIDQMENSTENKAYKAYSSVVGASHDDNEKKWIIDIDKEELGMVQEIKDFVNKLQPENVNSKVLTEIPSKTGLHLITSPFNVAEFSKHYPTISIQKNNPTNLFIP